MRIKLLAALIILSLLLSARSGVAADRTAAAAELKALESKIQTKLDEGKKTEADLADELKEFDTLLARHKGEKTDDVAEILFMKAWLYKEVLKDTAKGDALMAQFKRDFPDYDPAKRDAEFKAAIVDEIVTSVRKSVDEAMLRRLAGKAAPPVEGMKFPDFAEEDLAGNPLSLANYKGKVVLLDFWATWCGPCVHELPNVIKTYKMHHKQGLEIIGISLDQDREKLTSFLRKKHMPWPQYFDGLAWQNKLAVKYGVMSIPATYLLDGEGTLIGKDLRGEELDQAVAKALARK
jgi:peroxiredoxin